MSGSHEVDEQELKNKLREAFNTVAEGYDNPSLRFFPESAKNLPQYLDPRGNEHVLDVATGTGHAAIAIAGHLPNGRVTGVDFSEGMLARARAKTEAMGIRNIGLHHMDMQALDFPDNVFDAAVFSFSIFFVEDMAGLLRHVMGKVKPGGKMLATSFYEGTFSPLVDVFFDRIKNYGIERPPMWRFSVPEECTALLKKAGLSEIRIDTRDLGYYLADAGQWWDVVWNAGLRRFVSGLSPDNLARFKKEHLEEIDALSTGSGIWLEVKVLYAQGVKQHRRRL